MSFSIITFLVLTYTFLYAMTPKQYQNQGELIADFLIAGRGTVAKAIATYKINDASLGDKGFKPQQFIRDINTAFKKTTGIDIITGESPKTLPDNTMSYLKTLLDASEKVCHDNQAIINMKGVAFKGFIPATYGKMVAEIFAEKTGILLKQTTKKFRNTYNKPDEYETKILTLMENPEYTKDKIEAKQDGNSFRVMRPIYIKKTCLGCHGFPKGELDVAGRKKEGYKTGELRGAISVKIKMQ